MEEYLTIDFRFGALLECDHVAIDNVYSIDIHMDQSDGYFNMDINGFDRFVLGTIVQNGIDDSIEDITAITYNADCSLNDSHTIPIIKNGKLVYKRS